MQVLGDVTADEFETFVDILGKLHHLSSSDGARVIIDIIIEQAELDSDFQVSTLTAIHNIPNISYCRLIVRSLWIDLLLVSD